jgi:hypothetical protein
MNQLVEKQMHWQMNEVLLIYNSKTEQDRSSIIIFFCYVQFPKKTKLE